MSRAAELAELHQLVGNLRRCVTSLQHRYGDAPAMRRAEAKALALLRRHDAMPKFALKPAA